MNVTKHVLNTYLQNRALGVSTGHVYEVKRFLFKFLSATNWRVDFNSTLDYLNNIRVNKSQAYYSKQTFQIIKFLNYLDLPWAKKIERPQPVHYQPIKVSDEQVKDAIAYFKGDNQTIALIHLGCDSGLRAEELYQLKIENIDLGNRTVYVKHDPKNGQSTKTGVSRQSFFTGKTAKLLTIYFESFNKQNRKRHLFNKITMERKFRQSPIRCKMTRHVFSSRWERALGPSGAKAVLMGHSNKTVDCSHYLSLTTEELHNIYDQVIKW
ncbi:MAG: site-specific integrase [Thermoplasmata archaeon]|nr:site-specific integrase [Thermoplasmata archaeon]MBE3139157.1 site-specific integrase [Thermoplasmata archaeon]